MPSSLPSRGACVCQCVCQCVCTRVCPWPCHVHSTRMCILYGKEERPDPMVDVCELLSRESIRDGWKREPHPSSRCRFMEDRRGMRESAVKPPRLAVACPARPVRRRSCTGGASSQPGLLPARGRRPALSAERGAGVQGHPHLVFTAPRREINALFRFLLP